MKTANWSKRRFFHFILGSCTFQNNSRKKLFKFLMSKLSVGFRGCITITYIYRSTFEPIFTMRNHFRVCDHFQPQFELFTLRLRMSKDGERGGHSQLTSLLRTIIRSRHFYISDPDEPDRERISDRHGDGPEAAMVALQLLGRAPKGQTTNERTA